MSLSLDINCKQAGVLAPLFAIKGITDCGIGTTRTLHELIDWASRHKLGFVQMLPINATGADHSPYNLISSMALDSLTLSYCPDDLPGLSKADYETIMKEKPTGEGNRVDYVGVQRRAGHLLRVAAKSFFSARKFEEERDVFWQFATDEAEWLEDYTLYQALRVRRGGSEVLEVWPPEWRQASSARQWLEGLPADDRAAVDEDRRLFAFEQWVADRQWRAVRDYATKRGILLVGDVPVGVSIYSVDVWAEPRLFDLSRSCGAPPEKVFQSDPFTMQWGQNWGFPLYDWREMSRDNFWWWRRRMRSLRCYFDILRVDHALGFYRIYSFPWRPERNGEFTGLTKEEAMAKTDGNLPGFVPQEDDTAEHQQANQQHGEVLLGILTEETGPGGLIAEDLGEVPDYVRPSLERLGVAGFKIPQWERTGEGKFIDGTEYPRLAITTYGTHDHPPLSEIWGELWQKARSLNREEAAGARQELAAFLAFGGAEGAEPRAYDAGILGVLMAGLFHSNAWLAAVSINDLLGTADRFNVPGTSDGQNWSARLAAPISEWDEKHREMVEAWAGLLPRK